MGAFTVTEKCNVHLESYLFSWAQAALSSRPFYYSSSVHVGKSYISIWFSCALIPICAILDFSSLSLLPLSYFRENVRKGEFKEKKSLPSFHPREELLLPPCYEDFCHKIIFYSYLSWNDSMGTRVGRLVSSDEFARRFGAEFSAGGERDA